MKFILFNRAAGQPPSAKIKAAGNTYYAWPAWIPRVGIGIIKSPASLFNVQLDEYAAYDKGVCLSSSTFWRSFASMIPT
jgi:hypothetical protein